MKRKIKSLMGVLLAGMLLFGTVGVASAAGAPIVKLNGQQLSF
jgi:hypothetical protein